LDLTSSGWKKGVVFVNNRNLGRYWNIGPQQTMYLPGPWLVFGSNSILIFEEEAAGDEIVFRDAPVFN